MNECLEQIARLTALTAVSGRESACFDALREQTAGLFDEITTTPTGSFAGVIRCGRPDAPLVLLDAHIDEIGFVVTEICDGGFLRVAAVGGIDTRVLSASEVTVYGKEAVRGVFTSKPPHLQEAGESKKKIELRDLYIDTGYPKEALEEKVSVGDAAGFFAPALPLENRMVTSKALDDRICAFSILRAAETVDRAKLTTDVCILLSGGEEIGYIGVRTAAFALCPDAAVALDVTNAHMPGGPRHKKDVQLGNGPVISYSATTSRAFTRTLTDTAEAHGIPYAVAAEPGATGTNAHVLQITRSGVPTALVSVPLRYMHTCAEVVSIDDAENAARLLCAFLENFPSAFAKKEAAI